MAFEYPAAFLLLFFLPILIILEILRNRRRDISVASIALWRMALASSGEKARRKISISLGLILLVCAFLLSVTGAALPAIGGGSGNVVRHSLIIDTSASMMAGGAFTRAIADAKQYVSSAPEDSLFTVVEGGAIPRIACAGASSGEALRALDRMACTEAEADPSDAAGFALSYEPDLRPLFFSDSVPADAQVDCRTFGQPVNNVGFVAGRSVPGGLFFAVANYSDAPFNGTVLLRLEGTPPQEMMQLDLKPGERRDLQIEISPAARGRFILMLDPPDSFEPDNRLYFVRGGTGDTVVALLGASNAGRFGVPRALRGIHGVSTLTIDGDRLPGDAQCDAVVAVGVPITDSSLQGLYFLPPSAPDYIASGDAVKGALSVSVEPLHPFFRDADGMPFKLLRGNLVAGRACEFGKSWQAALECEGRIVLANRIGTNIWAAAFLPSEEYTDWVMDPSFVVFTARFAEAAGRLSQRELLRRTDQVHTMTGLVESAGYNLMSDRESDLRGRSSGISPVAPPVARKEGASRAQIGWLFFAAAAILLTLRAAMALYRT